MSYTCPKCGSDNITTHRNIFEGGTSDINTTTRGGGLGGGSGGIVGGLIGASTTGKSQTKAALKYSPPSKAVGAVWGAIIFSVILFLLLFNGAPGTISLITFAIVAGCIFYYNHHKKNVYAPKYAEWELMWHCNRCGTDFKI
ncbi:hypothetical protein [Limnohabitans sp. WS1]|uniref:hypothetical protein n=1 Tax=Limnohabitans sp. WS1 TaxID=1100726 RepID=UPI0011B235B0|nr:hypothetical protein [Limnohabitans sp. WS1]